VIGYARRDPNVIRELEFTVNEKGEWYSPDVELTALGRNFLTAHILCYLFTKRMRANWI
jgi:hypothetical protein